jgi:hypothetical protein
VQGLLSGTRIGLATVGFSPPEAMSALARHLHLTGLVLSDPGRALYRLLGLGRAPLWRVYDAATLLYYARAALRGRRLTRPVEDTRQLGGDAVAVDATVVRRWRPTTPTDRADPAAVVAVTLRLLRGH